MRGIALFFVCTAVSSSLVAHAQEEGQETEAGSQDSGDATEEGRFDVGVEDSLESSIASQAQASSAILTTSSTREMKDHGHLTLKGYLRTVPGFDSVSAFWHTWPGAKGMRGSINFMIDGVSATSPLDYRFPSGLGLFLDEFDRVEVISGPAGVPWGAFSMLGVINALTGRKAEETTTVNTVYGASDLQQISVRDEREFGEASLRLFAGYATGRNPAQTPGLRFNSLPPFGANYDYVENEKSTRPEANTYVTVSARYAGENIVAYLRVPFTDEWYQVSEMGGVLDPGQGGRRQSIDSLGFVTYQKSFFNGQVTLLGRGIWQSVMDHAENTAFPMSVPTGMVSRSLQEMWLSRFTALLEANHRFEYDWLRSELMVGADASLFVPHSSHFYESVSELNGDMAEVGEVVLSRGFDNLGDATRAFSAYAFEELRLFGRASLAGGLRYNASNTHKSVMLYQGNAGLRVWGQSYVKAGFAQGMRPPTVQDREGLVPVLGDPNLLPERSSALQLEANASWSWPGWIEHGFFRVDYSMTTAESVIRRESLKFMRNRFEPISMDGFDITTLEGMLDLEFPGDVELFLMVWNNVVRDRPTEDQPEGQPRTNHGPSLHGLARLGVTIGKTVFVQTSAEVQCGGLRKYPPRTQLGETAYVRGTNTREMGCFPFIGAMVRWPAESESIALTFSVDNLLDQRIPTAYYPVPALLNAEAPLQDSYGRTIFAMLEWRFRSEGVW
ncbi:TonB-dependent receptor domain-containing protein [Myxococcota bacterium]